MPTVTRIRASVAGVVVLAVVAALFAQDRPGAPRVLPAGPALDEIRGDDIAADMRLLAELGGRLANDSAMAAYNPNEQFARPRQ